MILLSDKLWFPEPNLADEEGLLAVGGDLKPGRLLLAYRSGIFPWFMDGDTIFWFCPPWRMVLFPERLHLSHSMKRVLNSGKFRVTKNEAFEQVIRTCAETHARKNTGTWITKEFIEAYTTLHKLGHAHSFEIWHGEKLAGGLYGVALGKLFCGESMFSLEPNASKVAITAVCRDGAYALLDCQVPTNHLSTMGAQIMSRKQFLSWVKKLSY